MAIPFFEKLFRIQVLKTDFTPAYRYITIDPNDHEPLGTP